VRSPENPYPRTPIAFPSTKLAFLKDKRLIIEKIRILFITTLTIFSIRLRRDRAPNPRIAGGGVVGNDKVDTDTEALPMNPVAYDPPMPYQGQGQAQGYGEGYGGQQQYSDQPIAVAQQYHEVQGQGQQHYGGGGY
jgi:hypothetical protein